MDRHRISVTVCVCLLFVCCAHAQQLEDAPPFSLPASVLQKAAAAAAVPAGTDEIVLLEDDREEFDAAGRVSESWHLIYKAVTSKGAKDWALMEQDWAPWRQQRPQLRARVVSPDGTVHELDVSTIADVPVDDANETLTDRRSVRAPLPAMAEGTIVEEEIVTRDNEPLSASGTIGWMHFGKAVPTLHTRLTLSAPQTVELRYKCRLLPSVQTVRHDQDGRTTVTFDQGSLPANEDLPPLLPPDAPRRPRIVYTTAKSWNDVARAYAEIVERQIASADLGSTVKSLQDKATTTEDVIGAILHGLNKQVRYTGIEFGESAIVPHPPAETLKHGYGDCKDKAALLAAALRAAGISAHVALLYAIDGEDIDPDFPGLGAFNHAIVYVPGKRGLWLDPTDPDLQPGILPSMDQSRWALIADAATKELVRTPELTSADNRIVETREFQLAESGPARVVETGETWGEPDADYRSSFGHGATKSSKESLQNYVDWAYASKDPVVVTRGSADDFKRPYKLRLDVSKAARGTTGETDAVVAIRLNGIASRLPKWFSEEEKEEKKDEPPQPKRTQDFYIPEPHTYEWNYRIVPPPGFRVRELPDAETRQMGPATLSSTYSSGADGVVSATLRFEIPGRRFSAEQGLELRETVRKLDAEKPKMATFEQVGFAQLAAGNVKEAISEFESLEKLHPKEALHHSQVSLALMEAGAGELARAEAQRAVDLEPTSAKAWSNLGWVLRHDLIGREDRKGSDFAGAVAAYRKVKELDPKDYPSRADLAILLEFNPDGVRYGKGARLDQAIAEYQEMKDKLSETGVANNLAIALMWAHRFTELRDYLKTLPDSESRRTFTVIADVETSGMTVAFANAQKTGDEAQRGQAFLSAGQTLMKMRIYDLAADCFAEGAKNSPQPTAAIATVEALRRTRRLEDVKFADDRPDDAVRRVMQALMSEHVKDLQLQSLFSARWVDAARDRDPSSAGPSLRASLAGSGLAPDVAMDIGVALTKLTSDGNDSDGWRVRMQAPGSSPQTVFVTSEGGQCRILSMDADYSGVGRLVLELAGQDKLVEARRWLDRVRGEVTPPGGDDPLAGRVFARLWTRGSAAPKDVIQVAAASLLVDHKWSAAEAIPILREQRGKLPAGLERNNVDYALATALSNSTDGPAFLEFTRGLSTRVADSISASALYVHALERTRGWAELDQAQASLVEQHPDEALMIRILSEANAVRGNFKKSDQLLNKIVDSGKAEAQDYNGLAWNALFENSLGTDAFGAVDRANMMTQQKSGPILHTAAAMYAEVGKTKEARTTILQRMEIEGHEEPDDNEWYVFGRILEQYGLNDAAKSAYRKLKKPDEAWMEPLSSYELAQRRLAALKNATATSPSSPVP